MTDQPLPDESRGPPRLFLVRGQGLRIPSGALHLSVDEAGAESLSLDRIEVSLDMCGLWLRTALDQLDLSMQAQSDAVAASYAQDDTQLGKCMEAECSAGMLAISAAAFALDALYAALKDRSRRVATMPVSSSGRRVARYKIIVEAIRREFRVGPRAVTNLRAGFKEVFSFRDRAVHPRGDYALPVLKAEVNVITEWRYVSFGADSARTAVRIVLAMLVQVIQRPRDPSPAMVTYLNGLRFELDALAARWRSTHGMLTDEA